jgi:GNAT superfamily N-acetyltransferase
MTSTQNATWRGARVARPAIDLARSTVFYEQLLQLSMRERFNGHDGYDGVIFILPGGGELELTAGPATATGGTEEDLLVLYTDNAGSVAERLSAAGVLPVESANPYWDRFGHTFLDPDGYRVVVVARDDQTCETAAAEIGWHGGSRAALRPLFELAEDSTSELDRYLPLGRVLVARRNGRLLGHLQLVPTNDREEIELKNMAVRPQYQGTGIGRALVNEAVKACRAEGWSRLVVATAAADIGNLRFYQRVGFRFTAVERDAFTAATGYPDPIVIDGLPLRDRVWLARDLVTADEID